MYVVVVVIVLVFVWTMLPQEKGSQVDAEDSEHVEDRVLPPD